MHYWIPRALLALGFNRRQLTLEDFERCCQAEGVEVIELALDRCEGFYTIRHGTPVIVVSQALRGLERLIVLWHELSHHYLHSPETCFFVRGTIDKFEYEAQVIAICAVIPEPLLRRLLAGDAQEDSFYTEEMLRQRLEALELFNL